VADASDYFTHLLQAYQTLQVQQDKRRVAELIADFLTKEGDTVTFEAPAIEVHEIAKEDT